MLHASGNILTIVENASDNILNFFSLSKNDHLFLSSFGIQGEGPREFSIPPFIITDEPKEKSWITLFDWGRKVYYKMDLNVFLATNEFLPSVNIMLPPELILTQRVTFNDSDSTIIGFGGVQEGKLFKYSIPKDSVLVYTDFIPKLDGIEKNNRVGYLYAGEMAVNREQKKLGVISNKFEQLEIYDFDLNLISISRFQETPEVIANLNSQGRLEFTYETISYFSDMDFSADYIFVLNNNRSIFDISNGICSNESELFVFDWAGHLIKRYDLEECPDQFTYDAINNKIIALFYNSAERDKLIQYYQL